MQKLLIAIFLILMGVASISGEDDQPDEDILPENVLAFPFGSEDYKRKIEEGLGKSFIWSEKKIMAWAQGQGFTITEDSPDGGYQYNRGIVFHAPGLNFVLTAPMSPRGDQQPFGWKLILDFGVFYSHPFEENLSTDFKNYRNILRYEIWIDDIYYQTIEIGYGINVKSPISIEIPYIRDPSGQIHVNIRMKNHPANFGILYDAFLSLQSR